MREWKEIEESNINVPDDAVKSMPRLIYISVPSALTPPFIQPHIMWSSFFVQHHQLVPGIPILSTTFTFPLLSNPYPIFETRQPFFSDLH